MNGLTMRCTCGAAPVQYEGTIERNGVTWHFYFRARWDHWRMAIAADLHSAVLGEEHAAWEHVEDYWGAATLASYMPQDEAEAMIRKCAAHFVAGEPWVADRRDAQS